jgi:CBS domain containing-hemolysin-like protein
MDEPPSLWAAFAALLDEPVAGSDLLTRLLWVVLLLLVNAFFVAAEFAIVSVRRSRIAQLASEGNAKALRVQQEQEQLRQFLSTTQLCITISSLALGWIGAKQVVPLVWAGLQALPGLGEWLNQLFVPAEAIATPLTFALLVYLQVVLGELIPKTLAILHAETVALRLIELSSLTKLFLRPFSNLLDCSSNQLLRLLGIPIPDSAALYDAVTAEELQLLIASSGESGSLEDEERELLTNVFEFGETVASEVMIPRTSIDAISKDATLQELLAEVAESGHSRYPAIGESLDDIVGTVQVKDAVGALGRGECTLESSIAEFIRKAHFEHQHKRVGELLSEMQEHHRALVVIVDEFGGTAGLLTVRDLVEEIVGHIADEEGDLSEPEFQRLSETSTIVQAQVDLDDVNEELGLELPLQDDYQTLGGFAIYQMQKIPNMGETFTYDNILFTVVSSEGPRLDRIQVDILPSEQEPDLESGDDALASAPASGHPASE